LKDGLVSTHGNHKWKIGKWDKVSAPLEICRKGFHASERILDAFFYVKPGCIARAEVRGESIDHGDKQCWPEMRIVKAWKWTKNDSVAMAVHAAATAAADTADAAAEISTKIETWLRRRINRLEEIRGES